MLELTIRHFSTAIKNCSKNLWEISEHSEKNNLDAILSGRIVTYDMPSDLSFQRDSV